MDDALHAGRFRVSPRKLGEGSQGMVQVATDEKTGARLAAKVFRGQPPAAKAEAFLLRRCAGHRNVIALHAFAQPMRLADQECSVIFMELASGGDLFDRLISGGAVAEEVARPYMAQLLDAIAHCHARGVAHRDIKLENVLLDEHNTVKLSDFGLAGVFRVQDGGPERLLNDRCGSKPYAPPELIADKTTPYAGPPVDVWSAGVCLFAILANFFPFDVACRVRDWRFEHILGVQADGESTTAALWSYAGRACPLSPEAVHFLDRMLVVDPARRGALAELTAHPWIRGKPLIAPGAGLRSPVLSSNLADVESGDLEASAHALEGLDITDDENLRVAERAVRGRAPAHPAPLDEIVIDEDVAHVYRSIRRQPSAKTPKEGPAAPLRRCGAFRTFSEFERAFDTKDAAEAAPKEPVAVLRQVPVSVVEGL